MKLFCSICLLTVLVVMVAGSIITFESDPANIQPSFTRTLTLLCSVNNSATTAGKPIVGRRDVIKSSDDILHLTSLVVTRNKTDIAVVTPFEPLKTLTNEHGLSITENVNGDFEGDGYIKLVWTNPTDVQAGSYACEANGISSEGHHVVLSKSLDIVVSSTSHDELVKRFYALESKVLTLDQEKEELQQQNLELERQLIQLKNDTERADAGIMSSIEQDKQELQRQNLELKRQLIQLKNDTTHELAQLRSDTTTKDNELTAILNDARHIESGRVSTIGYSDTDSHWHDHTSTYRYQEKTITFQTPYQKPPIVFLSVVDLRNFHYSDMQYSTYYWVELVNVTEQGATIGFRTVSARYHMNVQNFDAGWISFAA